jgi:hypothetical protein
MTYRVIGRLFALMAAVVGWATLAAQFHYSGPPATAAGDWTALAISLLGSFALATAILTTLALTIAALVGPRAPWPSLMTALVLYCATSAALFLFHGDVTAAANTIDEIIAVARHYAVPALYAIYWLFFVPKGHAGKFAPLLWLSYPAAIFAVMLWHSHKTGQAIHGFLDLAKQGSHGFVLNCVVAFAILLVAGIALRAVDRLLRPLAMD